MMNASPSIKDLIKDNIVQFDHFVNDHFFYRLSYQDSTYEFPIHLSETEGVTIPAKEKAIFFMRWIRKAIAANTLTIVQPTQHQGTSKFTSYRNGTFNFEGATGESLLINLDQVKNLNTPLNAVVESSFLNSPDLE